MLGNGIGTEDQNNAVIVRLQDHTVENHGDTDIGVVGEDDGIGIEKENDENKQSLHTGFGLDMMKERVALLNGKIDVLTAEDGGTSIEVIIPILQEAT